MGLVFEAFPEEYVALNLECLEHPDLQIKLANHPADQFEIRLAEIAAHCGIILDGDYSPKDLRTLAGDLARMLHKRRSNVIILS